MKQKKARADSATAQAMERPGKRVSYIIAYLLWYLYLVQPLHEYNDKWKASKQKHACTRVSVPTICTIFFEQRTVEPVAAGKHKQLHIVNEATLDKLLGRCGTKDMILIMHS